MMMLMMVMMATIEVVMVMLVMILVMIVPSDAAAGDDVPWPKAGLRKDA